jgi:hypothetical protein
MTRPMSSIEWTVWPLRRKPARGAIAGLVAAGAVFLVARESTGFALPAVAVAVFAVSLAPFYVPTRHRLTPEGITITRAGTTTRRAWSSFRSVRANETHCMLIPALRPSFLAAFRACTLLLDGNRAEVVAYAEAMVGVPRERADAGARG